MSSRPRTPDMARVVQVIETTTLRGAGTEADRCRLVVQYWDFSGVLLAERDPCRPLTEHDPTLDNAAAQIGRLKNSALPDAVIDAVIDAAKEPTPHAQGG